MNTLETFLTSGTLPSSHRDRASLLDQCRNQILSQTTPNKMALKLFNPKMIAEHEKLISIGELEAKAAAVAASKSATPGQDAARKIHAARFGAPAAKPVAVAVAVAPTVQLTSAAAFEGPPLIMEKAQFDLMTPASKSKFCRDGGTISNPPAPARKPAPAGSIHRADFSAMTPQRKTAFLASGKVIVD